MPAAKGLIPAPKFLLPGFVFLFPRDAAPLTHREILNSGVRISFRIPTKIGWHYLSHAASLVPPQLFYAMALVSRTIIHILLHCLSRAKNTRVRQIVVDKRPLFEYKQCQYRSTSKHDWHVGLLVHVCISKGALLHVYLNYN